MAEDDIPDSMPDVDCQGNRISLLYWQRGLIGAKGLGPVELNVKRK